MAYRVFEFTHPTTFLFAIAGKTTRKSEPSHLTDSALDLSMIRKSLLHHWGRENRCCEFKQQIFPQARALHLLRKKDDMPIRMLNFARFVLHINDCYAFQQRMLIQRVSRRIQRRRSRNQILNSFFGSWRSARPRQLALVCAYRQIECTQNASVVFCHFREWRNYCIQNFQKVKDRKRRAHATSQVVLTEWREYYAIRLQTLRHFWRRMCPHQLAIRRAERQVVSTRITLTIQSNFEKWSSVHIIMWQAILSKIASRVQSNFAIWISFRMVMRVVFSKWRGYSAAQMKIRKLQQQTLQHCWRCLRPYKMAILHAERQVTFSRIIITMQSSFEKWRSLQTNRFIKGCISRRICSFQARASLKMITQRILSEWREYCDDSCPSLISSSDDDDEILNARSHQNLGGQTNNSPTPPVHAGKKVPVREHSP
jgi:hypothetical protein